MDRNRSYGDYGQDRVKLACTASFFFFLELYRIIYQFLLNDFTERYFFTVFPLISNLIRNGVSDFQDMHLPKWLLLSLKLLLTKKKIPHTTAWNKSKINEFNVQLLTVAKIRNSSIIKQENWRFKLPAATISKKSAHTSKDGNPRFLPRHLRDDQSSTSIIWPNHGPVPPRLDSLTSVTCAKSRRVARIQEKAGW